MRSDLDFEGDELIVKSIEKKTSDEIHWATLGGNDASAFPAVNECCITDVESSACYAAGSCTLIGIPAAVGVQLSCI